MSLCRYYRPCKKKWNHFENGLRTVCRFQLLLSVTLAQVLLLLISQFQELLCTSHKEFWGVSIQIQKIFLCLSLSLCLSHFLSIFRQGHVTPSTSLKFKWNVFFTVVFHFIIVCLLVFFVLGLLSYSRIFHSYGDVTITVEGLHILTFVRHLLPLSSEDATPTVTQGTHLFIMVISEDPWNSHLLLSVKQWSYYKLFLQLRFVAATIRTPNLPLTGPTL